ncbi:helix-turn-helix domain-containing protein [Nakamurella sp. GG22]
MRPVAPDPSDGPIRIGARLRSARTAQGMTLAQVAEASNLTKGFLSRVERDETSPSVATLVSVCQVLSLPVGALFAEPEIQRIRAADAPRINFGGTGTTERLVSPRNEPRVQVLRSIMLPSASGGDDLYTISSDVEVVHVISGAVTVRFVDREIDLEAGDTLTFPGRELHSWRADPDTGAEVTWTIVPAAWNGTT